MVTVRGSRQALRWTAVGLGLAVLALATGGLWLRTRLIASLPRLDGEIAVPELTAEVTVERDDLGMPTVRGADRSDVAFALGFLHAQERFFQMDLLRRRAAGELAELLGPAALEADRAVRRHGFRRVAEAVAARAPAAEAALVAAYTAGVNAGLADLGERPFEYLLLRAEPRPWTVVDTPLVVLSMYLVLQDDDGSAERGRGLMSALLPAELVAFLVPAGTEWDAPVEGGALATPAIPGPEVLDLRGRTVAASARLPLPRDVSVPGSNNWVVAGARTADGAALLANDPHLPLSVPNTWYRASLVWRAESGEQERVTGVTLPGVPVVVLGANGRIAWGFTNSQGDWSDVVELEPVAGDPEAYGTPEGVRRIEHRRETIRVKGAADVALDVPWTIWGPVLGADANGRRLAYRWVAHSPEATSLALADLESAGSVDDCLAIANRGGLPAQNIVCADAAGRIGWTLTGLVPRRVGTDGTVPASWADGTRGWDGWLGPAEVPRLIDPPEGLIWTANARVVSGPALALVGDGGYVLGARAAQIRDRLRPLTAATAADMLAIQLDDRALFLARWRDLLLELLTPAAVAAAPRRAELRQLVAESWDGHASVASVGYLLTREFRVETARRVFAALTAACTEADGSFSYFEVAGQYEGPLWRLVSERPPHLLDPRSESWEAQLLAAADAVVERLTADGTPLAARTWGDRNTTRIRHPLSQAVPWVSAWLDMPATALPGDGNMPRVQTPAFGASQRTVVAPGHEVAGYFHMPGGQSGHPLSPYYRAGHGTWERGAATPFLPGAAVHTLTLAPAREPGPPAGS